MGILDKVKQVANVATKTLGNNLVDGLLQPQNNLPDKTESVASGMYDAQLEKLIDIALADGVLSEKSKQILFRKAESLGVDLDVFEMVLEARLQERQKTGIKAHEKSAPTIHNLLIQLSNVGKKDNNQASSLIGTVVDGVMSGSVIGNIVGGIGGMVAGGATKKKDMAEKKNIISNYPIPTSKNDILDFLSYAVPLAKKKGDFFMNNRNSEYEMHNEFVPVWKTKCEQIITKVILSMKDDEELVSTAILYINELGLKIK
jgi:hypothetical protein